jgi:hypothetical protein
VDIWEYFAQREKECRLLSLIPDSDFSDMCAERDGTAGQRGIFWGRFTLNERAFLSVFELIQVRGSGVHRERYSYYLFLDEIEVWGFDRDPQHDPPTHKHMGASHTRYPCRRMTFKEVAKLAWDTVSEEERLEDAPADFQPLEEQ